jgi:hypothetical protein
MNEQSVSATRTIRAPAEILFGLLADPATHAAIDGTGWVRGSHDEEQLTAVGQIFRMGMFHPNHPDKNYEMNNLVEVFDRPRAIAWKPGFIDDDGTLAFGGWLWRYDLAAAGVGSTEVTLTYDWSGVTESAHEVLTFPPFPPDHLSNSLAHLEEVVADRPTPGPGRPRGPQAS